MTAHNNTNGDAWTYPGDLSTPWKLTLTTFVLIIGLGYAGALMNVFAQNELNDGEPGLTVNDLVAHYHGYYVTPEPGDPPPSRMLQQVDGSMRPNFEDDESYEIVRAWLVSGAAKDTVSQGDPSPEGILKRDCLLCHADDSGEPIADTASFGPSEDVLAFDRMQRFLTVDVPEGEPVWQPPVNWRALALTTHAHILSVPVFLALLAGIFLWGGLLESKPLARGFLAAAPMALFALDVICWWLARIPESGKLFALGIAATGALFGLAFVAQWLLALQGIWRTR